MIELTTGEVADLVIESGAGAPAGFERDRVITDFSVDSRKVQPGALFVALPGERVDGHDFVGAAWAAGAALALVAREVPGAGPQLVVPDPLLALGRITRHLIDRAKAGGLRVIAITGSQGKTSTKDLLAQLLEAEASTVAPLGNLNTEIGVPLTVARIDAGTRFLVAEHGARGVGHIHYLCELTPPDVSVVLNVGSAHVGEFGSVEAIAQAKGELAEALGPDGSAVLNADDRLVWAMRERTAGRVVATGVGHDPGSDRAVWATRLTGDRTGRYAFTLHARLPDEAGDPAETAGPVRLRVLGRHQVGNAVAAAAAALAVGVRFDDVVQRLSAAEARSRFRMEAAERPDGVLVVNDAYNANPESMRAAIDALTELAAGRSQQWPDARVWAVLGDMLELGDSADSEHRAIGRYAAQRGVHRLIGVGEYGPVFVGAARKAGLAEATAATDAEEAVRLVEARPGDTVLVKASRGLALDTVAEAILTGQPAASSAAAEGGHP
ncbi:UDP-N-acetylmuramoyl-tripeptide--D-alanyl-D-alanine ligase [Microlunatus parietis]|uniref:UDP-N-acetylmuramoyl-tripeptide--D-alanyl-D-alanine ligase n=1 Tax=Microlunatus parietis TaxID=682979 RepID=A0A7Y9IER3_9ACTN|nr:UDP-N-acetylmuramoyl-tripeptide--D-alanyl-D-alanine ligase [Microlunatus parietis]NYE74869.1 UDP-N-acetylmuramoyl-tripeptide--D-alanyl-D-alanine ligase [Microlunatus parietis]